MVRWQLQMVRRSRSGSRLGRMTSGKVWSWHTAKGRWCYSPLVKWLVPGEWLENLSTDCISINYHAVLVAETFTEAARILFYHASDKIVGILLDRSRSHDSVKITVLGVEIRIGRLIEFEAWGEQSKMADDELVAIDLSWGFAFCTDF